MVMRRRGTVFVLATVLGVFVLIIVAAGFIDYLTGVG